MCIPYKIRQFCNSYKIESNLLSRSTNTHNVGILKPYHSHFPFLNQYIKFPKHKLHIEQIIYEELFCLYSWDSTDFKDMRQNVKSILKAKVHFYLHRAYCDISAECIFDTICWFSGWLNMKHSHDLLAEYRLHMTAI